MQVVCSHSIQHHVEAAAVYELLKLVMLCGWCCCHSCFCWTASCWDWSEVDRRFTRGDTQFAGMIKPVISKENLWSRIQQKVLYISTSSQRIANQPPSETRQVVRTGLKLFLGDSQMPHYGGMRTHVPSVTTSPEEETQVCSAALSHQPLHNFIVPAGTMPSFCQSIRCKITLR